MKARRRQVNGVFIRLRKMRRGIALALLGGALFTAPQPAWAGAFKLAPGSPFEWLDGELAGTKILTEPTGVNPIAPGDLPAETSAQVAGRISDETGTGAMCFATAPTFSGFTATGTVNLTGATVNLPSGAVDDVAEIAPGVRTGNTGSPKLATFEGTFTSGRCVQTNGNGNLEVAAGACSTSSAVLPVIMTKSVSLLSSGSTTRYMAPGDGGITTTDTDTIGQMLVPAGTWGNLRCVSTENGTSLVVTVQKGTWGAALTPTSTVTPSMTTAGTVYADTTNTFTTTAGQAINFKIAQTSAAAAFLMTCILERLA